MKPQDFYSRFFASFEDLKGLRRHYFKELGDMSRELALIAPHFNIPTPTTYDLIALERDPWSAKLHVVIAYSMALNQRLVLYPIDPKNFNEIMPRKESLTEGKKVRRIKQLNPDACKKFLDGEYTMKVINIWFQDADGRSFQCMIPNLFTHLFQLEVTSIARNVCKMNEEVEKILPKYQKPKK